MTISRRSLLKAALGMPAAAWVLNYRTIAAPHAGQVKITKIKTMGLDSLGDGCLIRIETDAGIVGYGEAGLPSPAARARIDMLAPQLLGQDPLAIERHFYMMADTQYSFMANIPTVSGIDIALWDIAGKITGYPIYRLIGGPIRKNIPVYSHGGPADMLDKAQCKAWADQVKSAPEGFTAFKFGYGAVAGDAAGAPEAERARTVRLCRPSTAQTSAKSRKVMRICVKRWETTSISPCIARDNSTRGALSVCVKRSSRSIPCGSKIPSLCTTRKRGWS